MATSGLRLADRRTFLQRSAALGGMGLLGGCETVQVANPAPAFRAPPPLAPIHAEVDRIINITVCLRPFRAAGPRLDAETLADKLVVHNYGHGGSGWSLSWGSGLIAVKTALAGDKTETRGFHSPSELASLPQKVIINCPGYGARALWKDESIVPVRGQLAWLIPQPEVTYGVSYHGVGSLSRRDGPIAHKYGADDSYGYYDANEAPDRAEAEEAARTIVAMFKSS